MTSKIRCTIFILTIFLISGCSHVLGTGCRIIGGDPDFSFSGYHGCGKKYKDGGEQCFASTDCEGSCILSYDWKPESGKRPYGKCESSSAAHGSWCTSIENHNNQRAQCLEE